MRVTKSQNLTLPFSKEGDVKDAETACAIEQSGKAMADYWDESAKTYDERHELNDPALWMRTLSSYVGETRMRAFLTLPRVWA